MKALRLLVCAAMLTSCSTTAEKTYKKVDVHVAATTAPTPEILKQGITRLAFGSCNKQNLPQPLWKRIIADKPDLFLWTGDVVYADTSNMAKLSTIYASELEQIEYKQFLAQKIPVIGVYDDHDYGENDGNRYYGKKDEAKDIFLDFVGEPKDSPRRKRDGIYTSYAFGEGPRTVRVILLDTRYNRDKPGKKGDMLGENQWKWLEDEATKDAALTIVVSSIQVIAKEHAWEKWEDWPESRGRLLKLLSTVKNPLIISGDRHIAEISKETVNGRDIYDITSSSMTHSFQNPDEKRNKNGLRVGAVYDRLNYGLLTLDWDKKTATVAIRTLNQDTALSMTLKLP